MAHGVNKVILVGNLGKDPELRNTQTGKSVANFSIATSESWKDANGDKQEKTEWHNIVAWGKLAEIIAEYVSKGSKLYIEGRLQTRKYDDKNGVTKYVTEVVADNMVMLDSKGKGDNSNIPDEPASPPTSSDGLPF